MQAGNVGKLNPVLPAKMCHDPYNYPEITWQKRGDGTSRTTLTIEACSYTNKHGTFTTRSLNGMIPGPIMRMQVSKQYIHLLRNGPAPLALAWWLTHTTCNLSEHQ